jgi:heptosyltransferase-3
MNILVVKFRHIGDVLLCTALLRNLRLAYADARIVVAINDDCADILKGNEDIDEVIAYPRKSIAGLSLPAKIALETRYAKRILSRRYDIVLNLTEGDRGAIYSLLTRAQKRVGLRGRNPLLQRLGTYTVTLERMKDMHAVERDLSFLHPIGLKVREKRVRASFTREDAEYVERILEEYGVEDFVHIHPVSRWLFKCWDNEKFAKIVDYIYFEYGKKVVLSAAPDKKELEKIYDIVGKCESEPVNLAGRLSLSKLSALISKAGLFIGVDTAPMHMAAAHDIPVIALFGPSNPVSWGPWENELQRGCYEKIYTTQHCGKHTIIQHDNDEILFSEEGKISRAMMSIEIDEVKREIDRYFSKGSDETF